MPNGIFDDDTRWDDNGNVYEPTNWSGGYKPKWDFWNQRTVKDNSELENQPDTYYEDADEVTHDLYQRKPRSTDTDTNTGGSAAGGIAILILIGIFFGIRWLVLDGKKSLAHTSRSWGIASLILFPPVFFLALITGYKALREIDADDRPIEQRGIALAGVVMGYIGGLLCSIAIIMAIINLFTQ